VLSWFDLSFNLLHSSPWRGNATFAVLIERAAAAGDDRTSKRRARRDGKYNFNVAEYNECICG
jgi:hypothetical protein